MAYFKENFNYAILFIDRFTYTIRKYGDLCFFGEMSNAERLKYYILDDVKFVYLYLTREVIKQQGKIELIKRQCARNNARIICIRSFTEDDYVDLLRNLKSILDLDLINYVKRYQETRVFIAGYVQMDLQGSGHMPRCPKTCCRYVCCCLIGCRCLGNNQMSLSGVLCYANTYISESMTTLEHLFLDHHEFGCELIIRFIETGEIVHVSNYLLKLLVVYYENWYLPISLFQRSFRLTKEEKLSLLSSAASNSSLQSLSERVVLLSRLKCDDLPRGLQDSVGDRMREVYQDVIQLWKSSCGCDGGTAMIEGLKRRDSGADVDNCSQEHVFMCKLNHIFFLLNRSYTSFLLSPGPIVRKIQGMENP